MSMMVADELLKKRLDGQYIVVTGANSGIGKCVSMQLLKQGATVVLGTRNIENGEAVRDELKEVDPDAVDRAHVLQLDLSDFSSIRDFAEKVRSVVPHVNILVNNAGIMNTPFSKTKQEHEIQMGVNHIGPSLLTELLTDFLKGTSDSPARIINTASCLAVMYNDRKTHVAINWDDFDWQEAKYDAWKAYSSSKLANVYHAMELSRRFKDNGKPIVAVSVHPGFVRSNLIRHTVPAFLSGIANFFSKLVLGQIDTWEGSQTTLQCVLAPSLEPGAFYSVLHSPKSFYPKDMHEQIGWPCTLYPNPNMTEENAKKLWDLTEERIKAK